MTGDAQSAGPQIVSRDSRAFWSAFAFIKFQCVVKNKYCCPCFKVGNLNCCLLGG